jgi:hypothetical protein
MPLPIPEKDESKESFISRCVSDEIMKKDFKDNKQRVAICFVQWKNKNKKMDSKDTEELISLVLKEKSR